MEICRLSRNHTFFIRVIYWEHACSPVCVCLCVCCMCVCILRSEDNLDELVLSFHLVDPRYGTWIMRLGDGWLYLLIHLAVAEPRYFS